MPLLLRLPSFDLLNQADGTGVEKIPNSEADQGGLQFFFVPPGDKSTAAENAAQKKTVEDASKSKKVKIEAKSKGPKAATSSDEEEDQKTQMKALQAKNQDEVVQDACKNAESERG